MVRTLCGRVLRVQILLGIKAAKDLALGKGLAVFRHRHDIAGVFGAAISKRCVHEFALNHTSKAAWLLTWQEDDSGLLQLWQHLRHQPLIAMGFRFRRSARLGPLRFNFSKGGLSSISVGGRGASFNIPISRSGAPRTTVGLPGTGLSWSVEHSQEADYPAPATLTAGPAVGLPNSRRFRPGQLDAFKQGCLGVLQEQLFAPGSAGRQLWELNLITRLLADPSLGSRTQGLLAVIETPEAMEGYLMRAQSQDDAKRRAHRCVEAAQEAARLVNGRGWLVAANQAV